MTLTTILKKRINLGVRWLNKTNPNWTRKIKIKSLDLTDCYKCICGQVFGDFWKKVYVYSVQKGKMSFSQAIKYGFELNDSSNNYNLLTKLWVEKIKELRKK